MVLQAAPISSAHLSRPGARIRREDGRSLGKTIVMENFIQHAERFQLLPIITDSMGRNPEAVRHLDPRRPYP